MVDAVGLVLAGSHLPVCFILTTSCHSLSAKGFLSLNNQGNGHHWDEIEMTKDKPQMQQWPHQHHEMPSSKLEKKKVPIESTCKTSNSVAEMMKQNNVKIN